MNARPSRLGTVVGRFSRQLRGVGVIAMPDSGLHRARQDEMSPGTGVLQLVVPAVAVGVFIVCRCLVDGVDITL